ncbi:MAG TPA: NfeD family protein [Kiritimatiellia bacterium]|nr:NfeD family protein [Kiritimatiellia bacterium]
MSKMPIRNPFLFMLVLLLGVGVMFRAEGLDEVAEEVAGEVEVEAAEDVEEDVRAINDEEDELSELDFELGPLDVSGEAEFRAVTNGMGRAYVIPIKGMIEPALLHIIRRGMREARSAGADVIVIEMDTPGGRVDTTEQIVLLLERSPVPTYTFVEHNAISAGAIIAMATDFIYMAPGSKIGDAMPVIASPQGGMQSLGDAEREKVESYVDSLIRGIAQRKGRDETMASAMVRRSVEFKIGDEVISQEGQILTMTHKEAERVFEINGELRPLLSEGTLPDLDTMLRKIGMDPGLTMRIEITGLESVARFIAMIAPLLLTLGMLALWIEFQTPGIGWGALVGVICLALFFMGHHIAGLSGYEDVLIFIVGIGLIIAELFLFPGFGVLGLAGVLLVLYSLLSAMTPTMPDNNWVPAFEYLGASARRLGLSMLMTGAGMLVAGRYLPKAKRMSWLVLEAETRKDAGYASAEEKPELVGEEGKTLTALRPGGAAWIGENRLDVVTRGEFVDAGALVKVVEVHGNRIVVEQVEAVES